MGLQHKTPSPYQIVREHARDLVSKTRKNYIFTVGLICDLNQYELLYAADTSNYPEVEEHSFYFMT